MSVRLCFSFYFTLLLTVHATASRTSREAIYCRKHASARQTHDFFFNNPPENLWPELFLISHEIVACKYMNMMVYHDEWITCAFVSLFFLLVSNQISSKLLQKISLFGHPVLCLHHIPVINWLVGSAQIEKIAIKKKSNGKGHFSRFISKKLNNNPFFLLCWHHRKWRMTDDTTFYFDKLNKKPIFEWTNSFSIVHVTFVHWLQATVNKVLS